MAVFTFLVDKTQEETTIEFTGEDPYLQYVGYSYIAIFSSITSIIFLCFYWQNFLIRGRCIGQPVFDKSCDNI